jgi:hypothetical protein
MSNVQAKPKQEVCKVYDSANRFALSAQPYDYQLSLHLCNMRDKWGAENLRKAVKNQELNNFVLVAQLTNLRLTYGIVQVRKMFDIICPQYVSKAS